MAPIKHPPIGAQQSGVAVRAVNSEISLSLNSPHSLYSSFAGLGLQARVLTDPVAATTFSELTAVDATAAATAAAATTSTADSVASESTAAATAASTTTTAAALSTTTITSSKASSTSTSSSILAEAVASTNLSWWQLLAICLGGTLVLAAMGWLLYRHRRKRKRDKVASGKKKLLAKEAEDRERELKAARALEAVLKSKSKSKLKKGGNKRRGYSDSDSASGSYGDSESESDDSISDGGTIRPSRRRRRGGRGKRNKYDQYDKYDKYDRRRRRRRTRDDDSDSDSYSETDNDGSWSDESYFSDQTYSPRRQRRKGRRRYEERGRERPGRGRYRERNERDRRELASATPPVPPLPLQNRKGSTDPKRKRDTFRDSVFSSYTSMKKAAVRLKYVEAKVKLRKQLEEEDRLEQARRDKVREANREIELSEQANHSEHMTRSQSWRDEANEDSQGSGQLLIPPIRRGTAHSSSSISSGSTMLPTPPHRAVSRDTNLRNGSLPLQRGPQASLDQQGRPGNSRQLYPAPGMKQGTEAINHNATRQPYDKVPPAGPRRLDRPGTADSLGQEISHLLGNGARNPQRNLNQAPDQHNRLHGQSQDKRTAADPVKPPRKAKRPTNDFQADWLTRQIPAPAPAQAHKAAAPSMPQTPRTDSVYLPVTHPQMRPIIPKGGLAPAPPPKVKNATPSARGPGPAQPANAGLGGIGLGAWIGAGLGFGDGDQSESTGGGVVPRKVRGTAAAGSVTTGVSMGRPVTGESGSSSGGGGGGGSKWANRLRERK